MVSLFGGYFLSVKKINDKDVDEVILKIYASDPMIGGKLVFLGYKIVDGFIDFFDAAYDLAVEINRKGDL